MIRQFMMSTAASLLLLSCTADEHSINSAADPLGPQTAQTSRADKTELAGILANQPEDVRLRYGARHPQETLEFFGLEPGMTVIEVLPGGGWYTKIISPYLGEDGHLIGVDYSSDMWPEFGGFARFNEKGGYLDSALKALNKSLKPGGIVGIVQHAAPAENDDAWADGNNGYLKDIAVIAAMEKAGFEFISASAINENPRDIPSNTDNVWRLAPTLGTSQDNEELRARMEAIGESNRMTLKFIKPSKNAE